MICASAAEIVSHLRGIQHLDCDEPVELAIFGEVHGSHASAREFLYEGVLG